MTTGMILQNENKLASWVLSLRELCPLLANEQIAFPTTLAIDQDMYIES